MIGEDKVTRGIPKKGGKNRSFSGKKILPRQARGMTFRSSVWGGREIPCRRKGKEGALAARKLGSRLRRGKEGHRLYPLVEKEDAITRGKRGKGKKKKYLLLRVPGGDQPARSNCGKGGNSGLSDPKRKKSGKGKMGGRGYFRLRGRARYAGE